MTSLSPLEGLHARTTRVARRLHLAMWDARSQVPPREACVLYGLRGIWRPTMALRAMRRMGPVRHALAQRMACGIIEVHAPFAGTPLEDRKKRR